MPDRPSADHVDDSDAFSHWAEEMTQYLERIEESLVQQVALEQLSGGDGPLIHQGVVDIDKHGTTYRAHGFHPVLDDDAGQRSSRLARLSESALRSLCEGRHYYHHDGQRIPVYFRRSEQYLAREQDLSHFFGSARGLFAKQQFLPLLTFPFLPYHRKYVEVVDEEGQPVPVSRRLPRTLFPEKIELVDVPSETASSIVHRTTRPVWNVSTSTMYVANQVHEAADGYWEWTPQASDFRTDSTLIIHEVRKRGLADPIPSMHAGSDRIVSRFEFDEIRFSEIEPLRAVPPASLFLLPVVSHRALDRGALYWFRSFVQSFQLTRGDVEMLLSLVPVTRDRFRVLDIHATPCPSETSQDLSDGTFRFWDPLWYVRPDRSAATGSANLTQLNLTLGLRPDAEARADLLDEDRVHFFAALCGLFLPAHVLCRGVFEA